MRETKIKRISKKIKRLKECERMRMKNEEQNEEWSKMRSGVKKRADNEEWDRVEQSNVWCGKWRVEKGLQSRKTLKESLQ